MRIGSIEFPDDLLTALEEERLVIFAGAGVSVDAPSCLPSFPFLVAKIIGRELEEKELGQLDRVLGRIQEQGVPVHRRAAEILGDPGSRFNLLHESLVGLFGTGTLRIVTTNFDRHFEGALDARNVGTETGVYAAPALPVASRFAGLVHLHGVLGGRPDDLVLTDADFGRAYLSEGWAGRFLVELFRTYTILFIGYSYGDTVMTYLTRGLAPALGQGRFALTASGEREDWELLGIQAIEYDAPSGDHSALPQALFAWVNYRNRGALAWSQRLKAFLHGGPEGLDPATVGELEYCLRSENRRSLFFRRAKGSAWLEWVDKHGFLEPLFSVGGDQERLRDLARWFTDEPLGPRGKVALRIASKGGRLLGNALAAMAAHQVLVSLAKERLASENHERQTAAWASLLIERSPVANTKQELAFWLEHISPTSQPELIAQIIGYLLQWSPQFRERAPWPLESEDSLPVAVGDSWGNSFLDWERLRKHIACLAWPLVPVLFESLERRWRWLVAIEGLRPKNDPWSWRRSWIEHPGGNVRTRLSRPVGIFLDIGKDVLDELLASSQKLSASTIEQWLAASAPQLVQLGLYGLAKSDGWLPARKVDRLLAGDFLPARMPFKAEVFRVLECAYSRCATRQRSQLLKRLGGVYREKIEKAPDAERLRSATYDWFNLLVWLQRAVPEDSAVNREMARIRRRFPEFEPRQHPNLDSWSGEGGRVRPVSPLLSQKIRLLAFPQWLAVLEEASASVQGFEVDPVAGFLEESARAASSDFVWGLALARGLRESGLLKHGMWSRLLHVWAEMALKPKEWKELLAVVDLPELRSTYPESFASLVLGCAEQKDPGPNLAMIRSSFRLAEAILPLADAVPLPILGEDFSWLEQATDHPGGKLAQFATQAIGFLQRAERSRNGLPSVSKALLTAIILGRGLASELGRVVLASQIHYFLAIDSNWTLSHLVPLFDWDRNPKQAVQAWHGFLTWGRFSAPVLEVLSSAAVQLAFHLSDLGRERDNYGRFVAGAASELPDDPLEKPWLKAFLEKASDEDRAAFAWEVGCWLEELSPDERAEVWSAWIERYLQRRAGSPPGTGALEFSAVLDWAPSLIKQAQSLVPLLERLPGHGCERSDLLFSMEEGNFEGIDSDLSGRLVALLLRRNGLEKWHLDDLAATIERLISEGGADTLMRSLIDKYVELGGQEDDRLTDLLAQRPQGVTHGRPFSP
jgi:SIR2-like domain